MEYVGHREQRGALMDEQVQISAAWFTCGQCGLHIEPWDGLAVKRHIVEHYLERPEVIASGEIPEWCEDAA